MLAPTPARSRSDAPPVLLYDGDCGLCARSVQFVLERSAGGALRFAPLQGRTAAALAPRLPALARMVNAGRLDSMVLVRDPGGAREAAFLRSAAAVRVAWSVGGRWRAAAALLWLVPRPLRDLAYRLVAATRLRWGAPATCRVPRPEDRPRLLP